MAGRQKRISPKRAARGVKGCAADADGDGVHRYLPDQSANEADQLLEANDGAGIFTDGTETADRVVKPWMERVVPGPILTKTMI